MNQKEPRENAGLFYSRLVTHRNVGRLGSLGTLLNIELDLLTLLQVAISIALNGGEMDENVLPAFALDEAEALVTVEPLDRTNYSFRHCLPPMAIKFFLGVLFVPSEGKTKQPTDHTVSCGLFF